MHWLAVAIAFSAIIIIHELGHFLAARKIGVRVERFSIGFGPVLLRLKRSKTEFAISAIPLGGYVKLAGEDITENLTGAKDEYLSRSILERLMVIAAGPVFNLISAFLVISVLFMTGETAIPSKGSVIGGVISGYPAEGAGLKKGDVILSIDKKAVKDWDEITSIIHNNKGVPIELGIEREKKPLLMTVMPKIESHKDIFARNIKMSFIGITPEIVNKKYNPAEAFYAGLKATFFWMGKIYQGLWLLITRQVSLKNVAGPIGILAITGEAAKTGLPALLSLLALISINLAVVNLLPFPILDGGHIMFLGLEKLRGKPLSKKSQEMITQVALYLLILLFILVSYNDLLRQGIFKKIAGKVWK